MSGDAWIELFENVSSHIGYSLPNAIHEKFKGFFRIIDEKNISDQLSPLKKKDLIGPIYDGLLACHYHKDNVQRFESEIIALAQNHIPYNSPDFNGASGGGNTGKITIEYQSFVLAEKHLLEYVTKCVAAFLEIPKVKDFSVLLNIRIGNKVNLKATVVEDAKNKLDIQQGIASVLDKHIAELSRIVYFENGKTPRNIIAHDKPLAHNQIGITVGPKGAVGIFYTGRGDLPVSATDTDFEKLVPLIQQGKGFVMMSDPLLPSLIQRLETLQSFVFDMLSAIIPPTNSSVPINDI